MHEPLFQHIICCNHTESYWLFHQFLFIVSFVFGANMCFADDAYLLFLRKDAKSGTLNSVRNMSGPPLILGSTGEGSPGYDVPNLLRDILKLNFKMIAGFPDGGSVNLAADRGEVATG